MEDLQAHLHRVCKIRLSNGSKLILKFNPSPATALLRHERSYLETEASVFALLSMSNLPTPRVLKYDKRNIHLGSPIMLTTHLPGILYADVFPYLTRSERMGIEQQLQSLRSIISQLDSTTFGSAALIASKKGFSTWREAFKSMMDSVLMDAEDVMVNLPYVEIRQAFSTWEIALDDVKRGSLVILGLGQPENVLLDRRTNEVTGLLEFGRAFWGDRDMSRPESNPTTRGLL